MVNEADYNVDAALVITTGTIKVDAVQYDKEHYGSASYDESIHRAYDQAMTSMKLGVAQGITFEGVTFRDDILATGDPEDVTEINSLLDSVNTGDGEGLAQMQGATAVEEKRLEGIRVNVYEYHQDTGTIDSRIATDADGNLASIVTDETGFFRFRLKAGTQYVIKTSDTVQNLSLKHI